MTEYEQKLIEYNPQKLSIGEVLLYKKAIDNFFIDEATIINSIDLMGLLMELDELRNKTSKYTNEHVFNF